MVSPGVNPELRARPIIDLVRRYRDLNALFRPVVSLGRRPVIRICALAVRGANADLARFRRDLDRVRAVWGQCGVAIAEGTFTTIDADLDYPNWTDYTKAPTALLNLRGNCGSTDIRAYYVRSIAGSTNQGRSGSTYGEPGYVAMGDDAHENLFPHELGHLFLGGNEAHRDSASQADMANIMRSWVNEIIGPPQVDQGQCTTARAMIRAGWRPGGSGGGQARASGASPTATILELLLAAERSLDTVVSLGQTIVPQLTMILTSYPIPIIRASAAAALGQIGGAPAVEALVRAAMDTDSVVRVNAITALGRLGGLAAQMILAGALQDPEPIVRVAALRALGQFGP